MAIRDLIRRLFGRAPAPAEADNAAVDGIDWPPVAPPEAMDPASRSANRRHGFWSTIGTVDPDVISYLISPGLTGGPAWPTTRQAYRIVRRPGGSVLIATDGMSDPASDDAITNGFGMELFVEGAGLRGDIEALKQSWLFELLQNVADTVAEEGGIVDALDHYGALSMEIPGVSRSQAIRAQLPPGYITADDALGVLIGGPAPDFTPCIDDMPLSSVRLVPVVLMTAAELCEIRAGDDETRDAIVAHLAATASGHRNLFDRPSIA